MDINNVLNQLQHFFATGQINRVENFLQEQYEIAKKEEDESCALSILNELIGYYRVTTQFDKALKVIEDIRSLIIKMGLQDTLGEGTSLLNIATVYRAMGRYEDAGSCYQKAEQIYDNVLDESDYRMAGLYNNFSLLYQEMGDYESAVTYLKKALPIIIAIPDSFIQQAVSYTNLGQVYTQMKQWKLAKKSLRKAEEIFGRINNEDEHFSGLANAFGYYYMQQEDYENAIKYYEMALLSVNNFYGRTKNYQQIQKDLKEAYRKNGNPEYDTMLDLCQAYYETYGKPMIEDKFTDYKDRIAAGLCGEGSECFMLEDDISMDHDYGPGFCLWVTGKTYEEIGKALQEAYEELPKVFAGYIRKTTGYGSNRCGVCVIDDFYKRVLGGHPLPVSDTDWMQLEEFALATATNGRVFADKEGIFTEKRNILLSYYPKDVWLEKLGKKLIYAAQTGQYNYGRMMARKDYVTASVILSEYMKTIMEVVYLLNQTYSPYYKWQHEKMKTLDVLPEIGPILEAICDMPSQRSAWDNFMYNGNPNPDDMIAQTIEIIAKLVVDVLRKMQLSDNDNPYLEIQGQEVLKHIGNEKEGSTMIEQTDNQNPSLTKEQLIDEIVKYEWTEFDQVQNEGGRANCQDDWNTFSIMRKSQYMTWTKEMLSEYLWHINDSLKKGRNLITEKYGRMMESTAPEEYEKIKDAFPVLSEKRKAIMETIIRIQVEWMEEFAKQYPKMAGNARLIHTYEDTPYSTSYETYLRGELGTYSEELMSLYGQFIVSLSKENKNLAYLTMENTAKLYGYSGVEDAEKRL